MTTPRRLKQADRVRWRLLSEHDRDRLMQICQMRSQNLSTVLRICARRYNWDVDAYAKEARVAGVIKLPRAKTPTPIRSAVLSKLIQPWKPGPT